jgi:hypothetical protein
MAPSVRRLVIWADQERQLTLRLPDPRAALASSSVVLEMSLRIQRAAEVCKMTKHNEGGAPIVFMDL